MFTFMGQKYLAVREMIHALRNVSFRGGAYLIYFDVDEHVKLHLLKTPDEVIGSLNAGDIVGLKTGWSVVDNERIYLLQGCDDLETFKTTMKPQYREFFD